MNNTKGGRTWTSHAVQGHMFSLKNEECGFAIMGKL